MLAVFQLDRVRTEFQNQVWAIQAWGLALITLFSFFPTLFHLQEYLFFFLMGVALVFYRIEEGTPWVRTPIDLPLILFVSWVLFTIPFSTDPEYSFGEWRKFVVQVLVFYWVLLVLKKVPELTFSLEDRNRKSLVELRDQNLQAPRKRLSFSPIHAILLVLIVGSAVMNTWSIVDFVERGGTWRDRNMIRAVTPGSDYNWLGTYGVMALPLITISALILEERKLRILAWLAAGITLLGLFFSYSRGCWAGLFIELIVLSAYFRLRVMILSLLAGLIIMSALYLLVTSTGLHQSTIDPWTLEARLFVWEKGLKHIMTYPITGSGYGYHTFQIAVEGYPDKPLGSHNTFFMIAIGSGIPALVFMLWVFIMSMRKLLSRKEEKFSWPNTGISFAVGLMVIGFIVRNFFDYMFAGSLAFLFWIFLAVGFQAAGLSSLPKKSRTE